MIYHFIDSTWPSEIDSNSPQFELLEVPGSARFEKTVRLDEGTELQRKLAEREDFSPAFSLSAFRALTSAEPKLGAFNAT
jgi:hypothetical protein